MARVVGRRRVSAHLLERGSPRAHLHTGRQTAAKTAAVHACSKPLELESAAPPVHTRRCARTAERGHHASIGGRWGSARQGPAVADARAAAEWDVVFDVRRSSRFSPEAKTVAAALRTRAINAVANVREVSSADPVSALTESSAPCPAAAGWRTGPERHRHSEAGHASEASDSVPSLVTKRIARARCDREGRFKPSELRPIVVGRTTNDSVEVSSGLRSGERIVTAGCTKCSQGKRYG